MLEDGSLVQRTYLKIYLNLLTGENKRFVFYAADLSI